MLIRIVKRSKTSDDDNELLSKIASSGQLYTRIKEQEETPLPTSERLKQSIYLGIKLPTNNSAVNEKPTEILKTSIFNFIMK